MSILKIDQTIIPRFRYANISNGIKTFYVEAGEKTKPNLLLLHGFPTSSRQFRELILLLAPAFHVIAPDLPAFGLTELPLDYKGSFDRLTDAVDSLLGELSIKKFSIYVFDYGAPTGFKLALRHPYDITAVITQNGNAYEEGIGPKFWNPIKELWTLEEKGKDSLSSVDRAKYDELYEGISKFIFSIDGYKQQYFGGEGDITRVNPELANIDFYTLKESSNSIKNQMDLIIDYRNNLKLYPDFQKWFRDTNVPILAVWGTNDEIFVKQGAQAYTRDSKNVKIVEVDGGHFVSHSHVGEIAQEILHFFHEHGII